MELDHVLVISVVVVSGGQSVDHLLSDRQKAVCKDEKAHLHLSDHQQWGISGLHAVPTALLSVHNDCTATACSVKLLQMI